jgi:hypothetical protein
MLKRHLPANLSRLLTLLDSEVDVRENSVDFVSHIELSGNGETLLTRIAILPCRCDICIIPIPCC